MNDDDGMDDLMRRYQALVATMPPGWRADQDNRCAGDARTLDERLEDLKRNRSHACFACAPKEEQK